MGLSDYLNVFRRRWLWIVATAAVCVVIGLSLAVVQTKQYASSARMFISTSDVDSTAIFQGGQFSQARVQSYADLVSSRELAAQVISDLDLDLTVDELAAKVTASVTTNTVNLTVTVTDPDPREAQRIAQTYAEDLADMIRELETPPGESTAPIKATIVDSASLQDVPVSPKVLQYLVLGLAIGILLGFALAVLRQRFDTRIDSAEDLATVTDAPVLGAIVFDPEAGSAPVVSGEPSHSPRAEAFRVLRTNLQFIDVDSEHKAFVITSAVPDEGKTTTSVNLAVSLAQAGVKTLLVEADLRRPKASARLGLDRAIGLTNVLIGTVGLDDVVQTHALTELDFLASGPIPPNPAELLQSNAMTEVMHQLRDRYEVVIIDAPPLLPVTDAALLAAIADGALLVVRHGKVTTDQVRHAAERLAQVDATLVGAVLNMVPVKFRSYGYGYGYAPQAEADDLGGK